jgi:hypothetical protein
VTQSSDSCNARVNVAEGVTQLDKGEGCVIIFAMKRLDSDEEYFEEGP